MLIVDQGRLSTPLRTIATGSYPASETRVEPTILRSVPARAHRPLIPAIVRRRRARLGFQRSPDIDEASDRHGRGCGFR